MPNAKYLNKMVGRVAASQSERPQPRVQAATLTEWLMALTPDQLATVSAMVAAEERRREATRQAAA